jgi:DNA-binding Lrp family transcriptional regulator
MAYSDATPARVLDALGDPTRRAVLEVLRGGAQPVGEIAKRLPVSRPAVSQHLRVLKDARLYAVDPKGLEALRAYLERSWDTALGAFEAAARDEATRRSQGTRRRSQ